MSSTCLMFKGNVSPRVYWWYLRAMTIPLVLLFVIFFALYEGLQIFSNIWLSNMSDDQQNINDIKNMYADHYMMNYILNQLASNSLPSQTAAALQTSYLQLANNFTQSYNNFANRRDYYLWWYLGYGGIQAIIVAVFSLTFSLMVASASRYIHIRMLGILSQL